MQRLALHGARAMSTAPEGDLQIVLGAQGAKDAIRRKLRLLFLFNLPLLIVIFSVSVKVPTGSQNH